jgi:hypothetical protein
MRLGLFVRLHQWRLAGLGRRSRCGPRSREDRTRQERPQGDQCHPPKLHDNLLLARGPARTSIPVLPFANRAPTLSAVRSERLTKAAAKIIQVELSKSDKSSRRRAASAPLPCCRKLTSRGPRKRFETATRSRAGVADEALPQRLGGLALKLLSVLGRWQRLERQRRQLEFLGEVRPQERRELGEV